MFLCLYLRKSGYSRLQASFRAVKERMLLVTFILTFIYCLFIVFIKPDGFQGRNQARTRQGKRRERKGGTLLHTYLPAHLPAHLPATPTCLQVRCCTAPDCTPNCQPLHTSLYTQLPATACLTAHHRPPPTSHLPPPI